MPRVSLFIPRHDALGFTARIFEVEFAFKVHYRLEGALSSFDRTWE